MEMSGCVLLMILVKGLYPLESFFGESASGLCLDRPEAKAACEEDRSPDQVRCHTLPSVLRPNPDHLDREHLVGPDLLKDVSVLMPELVVDSLDGVVALVVHLLQLLLETQVELLLVARVVDSCSNRSSSSSVIGNPTKNEEKIIPSFIKKKKRHQT